MPKLPAWVGAALFALWMLPASTSGQSKMDVSGTWMWKFPGAMHVAPIEGVLKLKQEGDKLTGSLSREGAERPIEQGKVVGNEISFQVIWYRAGQPNATQYKGKISGDTIKGTISSSWSGQTRTSDWNAKRTK